MQLNETEPRSTALLIDEETRWVRRPRDLVSAVIALLSIIAVMLIAIYGYSTTLAVTRDVRTATTSIVSTLLFIPINVLEGLVGFFLPLALVIDMAWHRRWRAIATALIAGITSNFAAYGLLWLFTRYFPLSPITGQLSDSLAEQSYLAFPPYVAILSAIITVSTSSKPTPLMRWSWPLLAVVLGLSVLQGNQTFPGALITLLLGVLCGLTTRYIAGDVPDRAVGVDLLRIFRRAGVDARLIVRIDDLPHDSVLRATLAATHTPLGYVDRYGVEQIRQILQKAGETFEGSSPKNTPSAPVIHQAESNPYTSTPAGPHHLTDVDDVDPHELRATITSDYTPSIPEGASRNYVVIDSSGIVYHAAMIDADQQIVGALQAAWERIVLTTTARHTDASITDTVNRFTLMELAATSSHMAPDRGLSVAGTENSQTIMRTIDASIPLKYLNADEIPDSALDEIWDALQRAHSIGLSHGNIHPGVVTLLDNHPHILHWEKGNIASSELERRIDMAQAIAMMSALVGMERAAASASRSLPRNQVVSLAPVLQKAIIPSETLNHFAHKKYLEHLRDLLTEQVPEVGEVSPTQLYRFSARTAITVTIGLVATYVLLASINFNELRETILNATPGWMIFAFLISFLTYIGAAINLRAYTAEPLKFFDATMVQTAASLVTLVAPAGVGPAALNLRYLTKIRISTPVAIATVSLVQIAQFLTTIIVLVTLSLATGEIGSLSLPSSSLIVVIGAVIGAIGILFLIRPLRQWIARKIRPAIDQIWPRIVWLITHPSRIFYGFLGSVIQTIGFVACFGGALASFGYTLPVVTLAVTYLVSNSVGSVVPSPGGIGPVEAALTGGLTLAGVPASIAFSTALLYRLLTFWGRVPLGWLALRYLNKHNII